MTENYRNKYKPQTLNNMTDREIDNLVVTAASVDRTDRAVLIGVMHANGQIVFANYGAEEGRRALWNCMNLSIIGANACRLQINPKGGRR